MNAPANNIWTREAVIQAPLVETGKPPVAVIKASTGADVERVDWLSGETFIERLAISDAAVDLTYLASGQAHLLDSHDTSSTDAVLGAVTKAWVSAGSLYVEVTGPLPGTSTRRDEVWNLMRQRQLPNVSVGYSVSEWSEKREGGRLVRIATRWMPREISLVAIGADSAAQVVSTRASVSNPMKEHNMNSEASTAERTRAAEIFEIARRAKLPDEVTSEAIRTGLSIDAFRARALDHMVTQQDRTPTVTAPSHGHNATSLDDPAKALRAAATAMLRRGVGMDFKGNEAAFAGIMPSGLTKMFLEARGEKIGRFESNATILQRAWHTTSDFPLLLGAASQTVLADLIGLYEGGISTIATKMTVPDFKTITEVRTGSFPSLEEVGEAGEITFGSIDERGESMAIKSFARALNLSFQAMTNDSLGGFDQALRDIAPAVVELKNSLLIAALGATMRDGYSVFHSSHSNYDSTGDVPSVASLSAARIAMRTQTAIGSTTALGIAPRYLVVPPLHETTAQQLAINLAPIEVNAVNPFSDLITPVVEPLLTGEAWYLAADPQRFPALKFVTLEGFDGPAVETEMAFTTLGSRFRVHWHVGAFVSDHRPLFKNDGDAPTA